MRILLLLYVYVHVTPVQLMRPGIGQNASCALSDWLTSRPGGYSQPGSLIFYVYTCTVAVGRAPT